MSNKGNYKRIWPGPVPASQGRWLPPESPFTIEVRFLGGLTEPREGCLQSRSGSLDQGDRGRRAKRHG